MEPVRGRGCPSASEQSIRDLALVPGSAWKAACDCRHVEIWTTAPSEPATDRNRLEQAARNFVTIFIRRSVRRAERSPARIGSGPRNSERLVQGKQSASRELEGPGHAASEQSVMGVPDACVGLSQLSKAPCNVPSCVKLCTSAELRMQRTVAESRGASEGSRLVKKRPQRPPTG